MSQTLRGCVATLLFVSLSLWATFVHSQTVDRGKRIFTENAEPPCALCHTLRAADAIGEVGPDLDELKPDLQKVRQAVRNGVGNMPPYGESLSSADIDAVARYVAGAVRKGR